MPIGHLELPNWENEDVSVSADGRTVLMSEFTGNGYTYVFQVETLPGPLGLVAITFADVLPLDSSHIVDCMDPACDTIYGAEGQIVGRHATRPTSCRSPEGGARSLRRRAPAARRGTTSRSSASWTVTADGTPETYAISDTTPMNVMDVTDPRNPILVGKLLEARPRRVRRTAYQHNNRYPAFEHYRPRAKDDDAFDPANPALRPGELLMGNGETNFTGDVRLRLGPVHDLVDVNWDQGEEFRVLDVFRPVNGSYDGDGDPAVNAIGCSGTGSRRVPTTSTRPTTWSRPPGTSTARACSTSTARPARSRSAATTSRCRAPRRRPPGSSTTAGSSSTRSTTSAASTSCAYSPDAPVPSQADFDASWLLVSPVAEEVSVQARYLCDLALRRR